MAAMSLWGMEFDKQENRAEDKNKPYDANAMYPLYLKYRATAEDVRVDMRLSTIEELTGREDLQPFETDFLEFVFNDIGHCRPTMSPSDFESWWVALPREGQQLFAKHFQAGYHATLEAPVEEFARPILKMLAERRDNGQLED